MKAVLVFDAPESCTKCDLFDEWTGGCFGNGRLIESCFYPERETERVSFCPLVIVKPGETYQVFVGNDSVMTMENRPIEEIVYDIEKAYGLLKLNLDILKRHPECPSVRLSVCSANSWLRLTMEEIDNAGGGNA